MSSIPRSPAQHPPPNVRAVTRDYEKSMRNPLRQHILQVRASLDVGRWSGPGDRHMNGRTEIAERALHTARSRSFSIEPVGNVGADSTRTVDMRLCRCGCPTWTVCRASTTDIGSSGSRPILLAPEQKPRTYRQDRELPFCSSSRKGANLARVSRIADYAIGSIKGTDLTGRPEIVRYGSVADGGPSLRGVTIEVCTGSDGTSPVTSW